MREVFQPADNIIAPNLQDFPWAPTCQLAIHPTSEKSKLPHHGFTCPNWLAPNSTLVTFIRIFLSKLEVLARQGGTSATLNSIRGSVGIGWLALVSSLVGIGIFIGWHWLALVSSVHQSNVLEGRDQLNGQLQMQMREKELKKWKFFSARGGSPKCTRFKWICPQIFLSLKSHILDSNGVWYWSEATKLWSRILFPETSNVSAVEPKRAIWRPSLFTIQYEIWAIET